MTLPANSPKTRCGQLNGAGVGESNHCGGGPKKNPAPSGDRGLGVRRGVEPEGGGYDCRLAPGCSNKRLPCRRVPATKGLAEDVAATAPVAVTYFRPRTANRGQPSPGPWCLAPKFHQARRRGPFCPITGRTLTSQCGGAEDRLTR